MAKGSSLRKWAGLGILSLALAIIIIDTTLINVSLQTIVRELGTTIQSLQWVITGYALVLTALTITGGRLGDLFGRRRMFMIGAVTFAIGSLVAATAHSVTQLIIGASVIEGIGAAMMMPATASLLLANFVGRERAIAFGVWGGVAGAAASIGPLLGGYLTTYYSWRWGYTINVFIVAVVLLFSWLIQESRETDRDKPTIDFGGIVLSGLGLASIVYGIIESSTYGWFKAKQVSQVFGHTVNLGDYSFVQFALGLGIVLLIMFVMWEYIVESRGKTPLVSLRLFSNSHFMAGALTVAVIAMGQFGTIFALPVFFQAVRGLDAFHNGLALLPFSLTVLISAPIAGALGSKKVSGKVLIVTGLIITTLGMYWLRQSLSVTATESQLFWPLVVFGLGFGMAFPQLSNITLSAVDVQEAGEATGVFNTFRQLGATLGNAVIGSVLIGALTTNIGSSIAASTVIPAPLKPKIEAGAAQSAKSLGQSEQQQRSSLPKAVGDEISSIQLSATSNAVKHAMGYGVGILVIGILASFWLPRGGHGPAVPAMAKVPAAPPLRSKRSTSGATEPVQL